MDVTQFSARYGPALEEELRAAVEAPARDAVPLYGHIAYHLGWVDEQLRPVQEYAGKRIRPMLCLLVCEACGGNWEQALPAAASVELLHNFSLIHDDIEDGDRTRRGRATVWALWGEAQAINTGDALFALAVRALLRLGQRGLPAAVVTEAVDLLLRASLVLTHGQCRDMGFEQRNDVTVDEYRTMIADKTGALLTAACEIGALVAHAPTATRAHLADFGRHLGLAFQVQDDILGIWGDPARTGKPVGNDILRGKKSLPILHGLGRSPELRDLLARSPLTSDDVTSAVALLDAAGSRPFAQTVADEHTARALGALEDAHLDTPAGAALRALAETMLRRDR